MAIHTRKYCPHCGHLYQRYSSGTKHMTVAQGCPIVACPRCGESFLDKDIKEPAFYEKNKRVNVLDVIMTPMFPFGVGGIFFSILAIAYKRFEFMYFAIPCFAFYAFIIFIVIKNKNDIKEEIARKYEESKKRLSDKDYVVLLINLGYRVPKSFLRENHPDLLNYKKQKPKKKNEEVN